jgi:hypothetical protein
MRTDGGRERYVEANSRLSQFCELVKNDRKMEMKMEAEAAGE